MMIMTMKRKTKTKKRKTKKKQYDNDHDGVDDGRGSNQESQVVSVCVSLPEER